MNSRECMKISHIPRFVAAPAFPQDQHKHII